MRYLIIGLGIYGTNLAKDLTKMGHEVIGADVSSVKVDSIKDYISAAYILDSTEESSIYALPLRNVDMVIVAIGENFGASIKTVALLKKAGVRRIFARAIDELHESILSGLEVERILTPEQRAAKDLVYEMELGTNVEVLNVDRDSYVLKFKAPKYFWGLKYSELRADKLFGLQLIAVTRPVSKINVLGLGHSEPALALLQEDSTSAIEQGDVFVCFGTAANFRKMFRLI